MIHKKHTISQKFSIKFMKSNHGTISLWVHYAP